MIKRVLAVFLTISLFITCLPYISVFALNEGKEYELINLNIENTAKGSEGKTISISWKNPDIPIDSIKIYDITGGDEILITDSVTTTPLSYVCYYVENLINSVIYDFKVSVLFEDNVKRDYFVSAVPSAGTNESLLSDGKWGFSYARYDSQSFYPAVFYNVLKDSSFDGGAAIKIVSNIENKKNGNYSILKCAFPNLEEGKKYNIKIRYKASYGTSPDIKLNNSYILGTLNMNTSSFAQKEISFVQGENINAQYLSFVTTDGFDEVIIDSISLYEYGKSTNLLNDYGSLSTLLENDLFISDFKDLSYGNMAKVSYNQPDTTRLSRIYVSDENGNYKLRSIIKRYGAQTINAKAFGLLEDCNNNIKITVVNKDYKESDGENYTAFTNSSSDFEFKLSDLNEKLSTLKMLINECNKKGLSVNYEIVNCATIEKFIDIMKEDFYVYNEFERANSYYDKLISLYEESYNNIQKYLDGTLEPKSVGEYVNNGIIIEGNNVVSMMKKDNVLEKSNVFLNGYGHFEYILNDFDKFNDFGANVTSLGVKFYDVVTKKNPCENWNIYQRGIIDYKVEMSTTEKLNGDYSLKITRDDEWANNKSFHVRQTVKVKPKTTYVFGLWAKAQNAKDCHFSGHGLIDSNYGLSQRERHDLSGSYDWKNFEFTYTTGENEYLFELIIPCLNKTEALYIDDVYVKTLNSDENLILNSGFENAYQKDEEFSIYDGHIQKLICDLNYAYENKLAVNLGFGIHFMPEYIFETYPDLKDENGVYPSYMGFNPTHPKIKEMITIFLNAVIPKIKDHPAIVGICVANEPNFQCFNTSYYEPLWQDYLKNMYSGSIEDFNNNCDTDYEDFGDIKFSHAQDFTPLKYHVLRYNDTIMYEYLTFLVSSVKNLAPNINVFAKNLPAIRAHGKKSLSHGIDIEKFVGIFDVNGCDAMHYIDHTEYPLLAKMEWYDLLSSVEDLPVFNTEDHLTRDNYSLNSCEDIVLTAYADMWQGAVHGRRASVVWMWDRDKTKLEGAYLNSNMLVRPDVVANNGKLFLDMQRLSNELYALNNSKKEVGILYSYNSMVYEPSYLNSVYLAYTNALYLGQRPLFVAESQLYKLSDLKILIIPEAISVFDKTYEEILKFKQNGGKLIIIGEESLSKNEFLKDRNVEDVKQDTTIIPIYEAQNSELANIEGLNGILKQVFEEEGLLNIKVLNFEDGSMAEEVEYTIGTLNGNMLINLCNYSYEEKEVYITHDGVEMENMDELISGKNIEGVIKLEPYKPVLIRYGYNKPSVSIDKISSDDTIVSTNASRIKKGIYKASASLDKDGFIYIAFYKDKKLCKVKKEAVTLGYGQNFYINLNSDEYDKIKVMVWYEDNILMPSIESIEMLKKEDEIISNVAYVDNMCYIFGNTPEAESAVSIVLYSKDKELLYVDEIISDQKGNFKFAIELDGSNEEISAKIKLSNCEALAFLIE